MAKLFGKVPATDFAATNLMSFGKSFSRLNGQPLDKSEIWYDDLQALKDYALTDAAYVGQKVVYVDTTNNKVYHYGIELDGNLKEIGTSPIGDEDTVVVAEDGTVSLAGVSGLAFTETDENGEEVQITYQPLLTDGGLTWVRPSTTTVEGLDAAIKALASNTYTKTQTDEAIAKAVSEAEHLKRSVVTELPAVETADAHTIYMVKDANVTDGDAYNEYMLIDDALVQIGDTKTDLADYKQWADTEELAENQEEAEFVLLDPVTGKLTNAAGLSYKGIVDNIHKKLDAPTDGSRLITEAEGTLLGTLESGAEKNVIDDADANEFTVSEDRVLSVKAISQDKITGLGTTLSQMQGAIDNKVEAEEGKGLSTNDFTDDLLGKLNGIDENAQVNVLEEIHINGTKLEITDKAVNIPVASGMMLGVVKSSSAENGVTVNADGTMTVNAISASKLVQDEDEVLVLDGGAAAATGTVQQ
jgi:hypothetical protein